MNRAAVSVFAGVLAIVGLAACGDHEAEPSMPTLDFTPVATLTVGDGDISCTVTADADGCEVDDGSTLLVQNRGASDHRLVGTNRDDGIVFDTGVMRPDDEMTLVLGADGIVTVTDSLSSGSGSPTLEVTVVPVATED